MGCTSNKCQGLIYTSRVETDGFGTDSDFDKTQRARLDRLKQQYREWSERYSQRETMDVDEYIQGLDEMANMSSELDAIMKQTGPMDAFGRARSMTTAGALVYYDAESGLLNNIASAQTQYLRVGINVAPDNPVVAQNRWDSIMTAIALMKGSGIGGPRAAVGASRIARMRNTVAAYRGNRTPVPGVAIVRLPANKDPRYQRGTFRRGVREKTWEEAKGPDGKVRDPVTGKEMKFDEPWDMGHKPGYEHWKHQESASTRNLSREQFLNEYNDPTKYRPELPSSNRSHAGEIKTSDYFGP